MLSRIETWLILWILLWRKIKSCAVHKESRHLHRKVAEKVWCVGRASLSQVVTSLGQKCLHDFAPGSWLHHPLNTVPFHSCHRKSPLSFFSDVNHRWRKSEPWLMHRRRAVKSLLTLPTGISWKSHRVRAGEDGDRDKGRWDGYKKYISIRRHETFQRFAFEFPTFGLIFISKVTDWTQWAASFHPSVAQCHILKVFFPFLRAYKKKKNFIIF